MAAQKKSLIATERDEAARAAWRDEVATLQSADLVFVDETSTHSALPRRRARAPRGTRALGRGPRNHGPTVTLLAALTPAGIGPAVTMPGAGDGAAFAVYAERVLAPSLRPGPIVILDKLSAHQSDRARQAVAAAGARLLCLPAYAPNVNPIELAFAMVTERLRAAAERPPEGRFATAAAIDAVSTTDARGFDAHWGVPLPADYYATRSRKSPLPALPVSLSSAPV